jgi:hypothetical protein
VVLKITIGTLPTHDLGFVAMARKAPALMTDLIRAMIARHPNAETAEIQRLVQHKHKIEVSRQSVQYARRVPKPKTPGRPRKNTKCPKCGHEFHARLDV